MSTCHVDHGAATLSPGPICQVQDPELIHTCYRAFIASPKGEELLVTMRKVTAELSTPTFHLCVCVSVCI
uniref:Uncharacterized protein n=1 Tax=Hyaloperonospora arabidopsidis (strain Emoy2) TaxID=559515 RepID=M4B6K0_HYAAE